MTSDLLTVKLEKMTYGGDCLGRLPDGRAVFVPFTLPDEVVRLRLVESHKNHARGHPIEILEPSAQRIQPKCIHFGSCGGCHYQQLNYDAQLDAKTAILKDQFIRIGQLQEPPINTIVPSPQAWRYRNHVQFHTTRDGKLGYKGVDGHSIIPIKECHLMETELTGIWEEMEFEPGLDLQRVSLRQGAAGELMIMLESALPPELTIEADISVVHLLDHEAVVMAGDSYLHPVVNGKSFQVSANAFFQVNTLVAGKMVMHLLNHLPISTHTTLLDLYCGVGLFSAFFAGQVEQLIGIELSQAACDDFCVNLDPFENVALYQAPVEEVLPLLDYQPEVVILDPPRSGLDKRVLDALQRLSPNFIAYVSCDPSTLARDANRLVNKGYQLREVTPFDMFPQTHHIESISIFEHIR